MNEEIIRGLADVFVSMKKHGMNIEKTVSSALGICDATPTPTPREEVRWFANQMEKVLRENDHKGGWSKEPTLLLVSHLLSELAELADAIENGHDDDVVKECVDVANYAMMIADECR